MNNEEFYSWAVEQAGQLSADYAELEYGELSTVNLFQNSTIDSMQLMNLLLAAEEIFEFSFTEEAFQDRRIQTFQGMLEVITELKNDRYVGEG